VSMVGRLSNVEVTHHVSTHSLGTQFCVDERYECHKQIGHGAYGVVCSGYDNIKKTKIAIKKVPFSNYYI
jgi:serine/threonine protein kinase